MIQEQKGKKIVIWTVVSILVLLWTLATLIPFLFMILATFKDSFEMMMNGVFSLPEHWNFVNFKTVLSGGFMRFFFNSVIVVSISLTALLLVSASASYPLSRFRFRLNKPIYGLIVAAMSVPIHVTFIPIYVMSQDMGLYDSIWALIGPYIAFNLPISVFILTTFMGGIPKELEEAAEMDGSSKYGTFFRVILPLSKPGLATLAIYNAVNMWNEFSFALILTQTEKNRTLPLAIFDYQGQYTIDVPLIMTVLTLSVLPMILAFIIFQDKLIKGMMVGAVKG